jgi:hypothetical protein
MIKVKDLKELLAFCGDEMNVGLTVKSVDDSVFIQDADITEAFQAYPPDAPTYAQVVGVAKHLSLPLATAKAFAVMERSERKMVLALLHVARTKEMPDLARPFFEELIRALELDHDELKLIELRPNALERDGSVRYPVIKLTPCPTS